MGEPLVTLEELAAYLSPAAPRSLEGDVLAELAINGASDRIRSETGQRLDFVEDDTVILSASGSRRDLLVPELPVISVDEVRVDDEVELDWVLLPGGILRFTGLAGYWPRGDANVEIDYSHGYEWGEDASAETLPAELKLLALTLAGRAYQQGLARQEATGSSSITYSVASSLDLSSGEKNIIAKYRHPKAAVIEAAGASA